MKKKVDIVMPVFNRRELTLQCLKSLARIDRTGLEVHIIVVDNLSADGTAAAIGDNFPEVEVIPTDGNSWYTAATNRGISAAMLHHPDYVLCCNDDSIFDEHSVRNLVECAEKYPRSVVGAVLLDWAEPHRVFQISPQFKVWTGGFRHWRKQTVWTIPQKPWEVAVIAGNCVLYPAESIRQAGLMDEKNLIQYGDAEYTPRMHRKGWRLLIEPAARVFCMPNIPPPNLRLMNVSKKLTVLFRHSGQPHSLRRRIYMTIGGAPTLLQGLLALPVFFFRVIFGRTYEGAWADGLDEKPLAETFANSVVRD